MSSSDSEEDVEEEMMFVKHASIVTDNGDEDGLAFAKHSSLVTDYGDEDFYPVGKIPSIAKARFSERITQVYSGHSVHSPISPFSTSGTHPAPASLQELRGAFSQEALHLGQPACVSLGNEIPSPSTPTACHGGRTAAGLLDLVQAHTAQALAVQAVQAQAQAQAAERERRPDASERNFPFSGPAGYDVGRRPNP
ncbi:unnamed protein product, partial [Effrenium voratum]